MSSSPYRQLRLSKAAHERVLEATEGATLDPELLKLVEHAGNALSQAAVDYYMILESMGGEAPLSVQACVAECLALVHQLDDKVDLPVAWYEGL